MKMLIQKLQRTFSGTNQCISTVLSGCVQKRCFTQFKISCAVRSTRIWYKNVKSYRIRHKTCIRIVPFHLWNSIPDFIKIQHLLIIFEICIELSCHQIFKLSIWFVLLITAVNYKEWAIWLLWEGIGDFEKNLTYSVCQKKNHITWRKKNSSCTHPKENKFPCVWKV